MRSFLPGYKKKVASIDEIQTMKNMTRDMMIDNLATFELSEFGGSLSKIEFAFKATIFEK